MALAVGLAIVFYAAWEWAHRGLRAYNITVFPLDDADEWRYTACSRLILHGYQFFTQVFSAQPPLLFLSLSAGMRVAGDSIAGARFAEIGFGLVALAATVWLAWMLGGYVAGGVAAVLLAVSPLFLVYNRAVEAEGPMTAMLTLGLAFCLAYNRSGRRVLAAAGGLALAAAILFKLFAVVGLVPGVWIVAYRPETSRRRLWACAGLVGAAVVPVALEMALVAPSVQWDQVIRLHEKASSLSLPNALSNTTILRDFFSVDLGLTVLAVCGLVVLALIRCWEDLGFLALWTGGSTLMLALFHPLFPHHAAILLTALAVCAGTGAGGAWEALRDRHWVTVAPIAVAGVLYLLFGVRIVHDDRHVLLPWNDPTADALTSYVQAHTAPSDFVAADDLKVADMAHRLVPPSLCDPSTVRLLAGYLSARTLIHQTATYRAKMVLPRGTYLGVPEYLHWVQRNYRKVQVSTAGVAYVRK
jgi:4-amino-4-deoxy-L-arabinose transferase-like glycosyltransferase